MSRFTARLLLVAAVCFSVWIGIFAIAMVSQLADAADRLHAGAGQFTFGILTALLVATVALPTLWILRLPAALRYPLQPDAHSVAQYHQRLRQTLRGNPRVHGLALETEDDIAQALAHLQGAAQAETKRTAASVFASTALLQNGRLDGLVVLVSQIQLVWRIAKLYGLRPSFRQLAYLYSNVGASVLIADSFAEVDFSELTAPIVQSATPAAMASIPGLGGISHLLTNSLASGAANAFLTLRVGLIAAAYCAPQHAPLRSELRQNATRRAAQLLGGIVKDCGAQVTQAVYGRIKNSIITTAQAAADNVKQAGRSVGNVAQSAYQATAQGLQQASAQVRNTTSSTTQRLQQSLSAKSKDNTS